MKTNWFWGILIALLLMGCAQIRSVEGGPKDVTPPTLLNESVTNGQTYLQTQELIFDFNEYIQLQDVQNQIIISPAIVPPPTISSKGKKVVVKWENPLSANTTYTFQFGDAIADITENNAVNLERVYSTGSTLDSLMLNFSIVDGWDKKFLDDGVVMLLEQPFHPDSVLKVAYQKKVKKGTCAFQHLPNKFFHAVAFQDNNKDGQYTAGEWIEWVDSPIRPKISLDTTALAVAPLFRPFSFLNGIKVDSIGHAQWHWPIEKPPVVVIKDNLKGQLYIQKDTAHFYLIGQPDDQNHTIQIQWEKGEQDSLTIPFYSEAIQRFNSIPLQIAPSLFQKELPKFHCSMPIDSIDQNKIQWQWSKEKSNAKISYEYPYIFIYPTEQKKEEYTLTLLPNCFESNQTAWPNDTLVLKGIMQGKEDWGEIQWELSAPNKTGYYVLLGNSTEDIQFTVKNWPSKMFLKPGKYQLKWVEDLNQNERWDAGNYSLNLHAERVEVLKKTIEVRANWTQVIRWEIQ